MKLNSYKHKHENPIIFDDVKILPGQNALVKIPTGKLPSGSKLDIAAHIFRSNVEGPCLLLIGGIHGDEVNGIEIVINILERNLFQNLKHGSIIVIPLTNIYGFNNLSRDMPDGRDINRSFPGTSSGSLASRVASTITKLILPYVDYVIDFHTGSAERYNYPQVRFTKGDKVTLEMAKIFHAPFTIEQPVISNSFRKIAKESGTHLILYEGGEAVRINQTAITFGINGTLRVLNHLGFINFIDESPITDTEMINHTTWVRASQAGIFIWDKKSGTKIAVGDLLGVIRVPNGTKSLKVISKHNGFIIGHNNVAVVNQGDPLFHIGFYDSRKGF